MVDSTQNGNKSSILPVLPLKNVILLPKEIIAVKASRNVSIAAVNQAFLNHSGKIFVSAQKNPDNLNLTMSDLGDIGVIAQILESTQEEDGSLKLIVEGITRAKGSSFCLYELGKDSFFATEFELILHSEIGSTEQEAYLKTLKACFKEYSALEAVKPIPEFVKAVKLATNLERAVDLVATILELNFSLKKEILENQSLAKRSEIVLSNLTKEIELAKVELSIKKRVQSQIEKHQKDYYLNEQVRAIYKEMGKDDIFSEIEKIKVQGKKLRLSKEAYEKLLTECKRLEQMQQFAPEATVCRSYIEWLLAVPWFKQTKDLLNLNSAKKILDKSHAGMKKAKETVLEYLAAKKFAKDSLKSSPIICLVGPPGVGKTTLASSIAQVLGRKFIRISLGGVRDEAEIRGHRRTYIGALPGKIISAMRTAEVVNPVILLDEIDKMSSDFRGDPASALLEVLDPEQNRNFSDHFLETGYDLSKVIFIATANLLENIPYPLIDRMEIINLSGYTEAEKLTIAETFLLPRLFSEHKVEKGNIEISQSIIKKLINEYTREAGVRILNRLLLKLIRKSILVLLDKHEDKVIVNESLVEEWLGYPKFKDSKLSGDQKRCGIATGLAWTEVGGDTLEVEVVKLKGKGNLTITGQLGEVMQESAQASLSCIRAKTKELGLKEGFYSNYDLHIHIPEGATPKDGPSAGITMATGLASILTDIPVRKDTAMSGEITLQGRVLAVGGLKEKLLAAARANLKTVIIPKENEAEVTEFQKELNLNLDVKYVEMLDEVLDFALIRKPFKADADALQKPLKSKSKKSKTVIPSVRAKTKLNNVSRSRARY